MMRLKYVYILAIYTLCIDLNTIVSFDWDECNNRKSLEKYDVTQAEAGQVVFNEPLLFLIDEKHSKKEVKYHTYGKTDAGKKVTYCANSEGW